MRTHFVLAAAALLPEDSAAVCECVPDRRPELPKDLPQRLLEVFIDLNVLVVPEEAVRQLREVGDFEIGIILPSWR